jgi:tRNA(Arg) A34 adenosine deaminase TadA
MQFSGHKEMLLALEMAKKAKALAEVPIGAVITDKSGNIIAQAHNLVEANKDGTAHAEMLVLQQASKYFKDNNIENNRLTGCTLFVTLEPCAMCAMAISHARISKLVYGAADEKGGAIENGAKIFSLKTTHHKPEIISGIMSDQSQKILKDFFDKLRK